MRILSEWLKNIIPNKHVLTIEFLFLEQIRIDIIIIQPYSVCLLISLA